MCRFGVKNIADKSDSDFKTINLESIENILCVTFFKKYFISAHHQ